MMTIHQLTQHIVDKTHFNSLQDYKDFARAFLDFAEQGLQARIVCQNEVNYQFFQFREDCGYNISRPINSDLFGDAATFENRLEIFDEVMCALADGQKPLSDKRLLFNGVVYTLQQSIGVALDALPASSANQAKKINGDLFERLVRLLMKAVHVDCDSGVLPVVIKDDAGNNLLKMNYQHDLIGRKNGKVAFLGSVKTSSKDRIDKIFIDKLLFNRFTNSETPYIAVFLNDVQRAKSQTFGKHRINSTFLSGHFKAYTLRLTSIDGVYYCDLRPNMKSDPFLAQRIYGIDRLFFDELGKYVK